MGIIFDLDGTLLNSVEDLADSLNRVLERNDLPTHEVNAYYYFVGNGMRKLVERALPDDYEGNTDAILQGFLEEYSIHYKDKSVLYPGVYETLQRLNQLDIPIAICTNKKQEYVDEIVRHYFPDIRFAAVLGDRFDGKQKPDPAHALAIADIMKTEPQHILFVGDSNVDMQTAHNARMIPVGVSWGFRDVSELQEAGSKIIIHKVCEIISEFNKCFA